MFKKILFLLSLIILLFPLTYLLAWSYNSVYSLDSNSFNLVGGSFWGPSYIFVASFIFSFLFLLFFYLAIFFEKKYSLFLFIIICLLTFYYFINFSKIELFILLFSGPLGFILGFVIKARLNRHTKQ